MFVAISIVFLLVSTANGFYWGVPFEDTLRLFPPVLLYVGGLMAVGALMASGLNPIDLWKTVLKAAFIGLLAQVAFVASIEGIDLNTIRYQILIGSTPLLSAYLVGAIMIGGWVVWTTLMSITNATLILVSVTRTQILVLLVIISAYVLMARERMLNLSRISLQLFVAFAIVVVLVSIDSVLPVSQIERWVERFTVPETHHGGYDVTEITRAGESGRQIELLKAHPVSMLIGYGVAHPTGMTDEARAIAIMLVGSAGDYIGTGFGHNHYVGTVFVGGFLAGGALLLSQIWASLRALTLIRFMSSVTRRRQFRWLISAPLAVIAYMGFGLLAGTLYSRSYALMFAVSIGFTLWIYGSVERYLRSEMAPPRKHQ